MSEQARDILEAELDVLAITLSEKQVRQLVEYVLLLDKWNNSYNLTAIKTVDEMVTRHLLDSLSIIQYLKGTYFADVGTGAGLPGIPLAVCLPETRFDLIDSNSKKTRFLLQAVHQLGLNNVDVYHSRVEELEQTAQYDGITTRAFASLEDMIRSTQSLLSSDGCFYAMKAAVTEAELSALPTGFSVVGREPLIVPGEPAARELVLIKRDQT